MSDEKSQKDKPADVQIAEPAGVDNAQVTHICDLALGFFDNTHQLHELGEPSRSILYKAAQLTRNSLPPGKKKPLKVIHKLVKAQFKDQVSKGDEELLVALVAFQHGRLKRKDISKLNISPVHQREVLTLGAILQIAQGMDASNTQTTILKQVRVGLKEIWVVIEGPQAQLDAAAARDHADLWEKIGYPPLEFLETSEVEHKQVSLEVIGGKVGIEPGDLMAEAGRKVFYYQFAQMLKNEPGTRLGEDIEALHDMRVATRRLRAAFEVFRNFYSRKILKPHLEGLRATGRALGRVRDLDVLLEKALRYQQSLPEEQRQGLDLLIDHWHNQRDQARDQMLFFMDSPDYLNFKEKFYLFVTTPGVGDKLSTSDLPEPERVEELTPLLIYERMAATRAYERLIPNARVEQLHALRIEFKQLRYTVEYFREVLAEPVKEVIETIKSLQDHLGNLNDAQVAIGLLEEYIAAQETNVQSGDETFQPPDLSGVEAYLAERKIELQQLIDTFPDVWQQYDNHEFRQKLALAIAIL